MRKKVFKKYADGGPLLGANQPTMADSLAMYNNSKKVQDYYGSRNYTKSNEQYFKNNSNRNESVAAYNKESLKIFNSTPESLVPLANGEPGLRKVPENMYYKKLNNNKYMQRERAADVLDTRAPMQLFDKRISPTKSISYNNDNKSDSMYGDMVNLSTYDPVLVKPVSMLTPAEKALRVKRYGESSGIQPITSKPSATPSAEIPKIEKQVVTPPKPVYKYDDGVEDIMAPTPYGGGSAFVGIKKKDGTVQYVQPEDYQRMGVPGYGVQYIKAHQPNNDSTMKTQPTKFAYGGETDEPIRKLYSGLNSFKPSTYDVAKGFTPFKTANQSVVPKTIPGAKSVYMPKETTRASVFSKMGDVVPYISNIANSFKRAPLPSAPGSINPVAATRVNFDSQRAEADRMLRGANIGADKNLDENTAGAVKASNLASGIRAKNSISENESNMNSQIGLQTNQLNASIDMQNTAMGNQWKRDLVEANVANQREQSANLSNAADKYIGQQQFKSAQELDREKYNAMKPLWSRSGVDDRTFGEDSAYAADLKKRNPVQYDAWYGKKAYGGRMKSVRRKAF